MSEPREPIKIALLILTKDGQEPKVKRSFCDTNTKKMIVDASVHFPDWCVTIATKGEKAMVYESCRSWMTKCSSIEEGIGD